MARQKVRFFKAQLSAASSKKPSRHPRLPGSVLVLSAVLTRASPLSTPPPFPGRRGFRPHFPAPGTLLGVWKAPGPPPRLLLPRPGGGASPVRRARRSHRGTLVPRMAPSRWQGPGWIQVWSKRFSSSWAFLPPSSLALTRSYLSAAWACLGGVHAPRAPPPTQDGHLGLPDRPWPSLWRPLPEPRPASLDALPSTICPASQSILRSSCLRKVLYIMSPGEGKGQSWKEEEVRIPEFEPGRSSEAAEFIHQPLFKHILRKGPGDTEKSPGRYGPGGEEPAVRDLTV